MIDVLQKINQLMRTFIIFLLVLLVPVLGHSIQESPLNAHGLDISSQRQGRNSVIKMVQDKDGFIWLASIHALYVYDGNMVREVLTEALDKTKINDILIDRHNTLWIGTNNGILALNLENERMRWYQRDGNRLDICHALFQDRRGILWAGMSKSGLMRFEPSFNVFQPIKSFPETPDKPPAIIDICESPGRDIYVTSRTEVLRLTGSQPPGSLIPFSTEGISGIQVMQFDSTGTLWVAGTKGLFFLPPGATQLQPFPDPSLSGMAIRDLFTDAKDDIWIASNRGLYRLDRRQHILVRHPLQEWDNPTNRVSNVACVNKLPSGTLWVGTFAQGVYECPPRLARLVEVWTKAPKPQRLLGITCSYNPWEKRIYVAPKTGGVYRSLPLEPSDLTHAAHLIVEPALDCPRISAMHWLDATTLLCGGSSFIHHNFDSGTHEKFSVPTDTWYSPGDLTIRDICTSLDGTAWITNKHTLYTWRPGDDQIRLKQSFPIISTMARGDKTLWLGTDRSITAVDLSDGAIRASTIPPTIFSQNTAVYSLFADKDELWIGGNRELFRYDQKSGVTRPVPDTTGAPLPGVLSLFRDADANIWMHTQDSIYRIAMDDSNAKEVARGATNPSQSISSPPVQIPGGPLFYGHSDGLFLVSPEAVHADTFVQPVVSEVKIFGAPLNATRAGRMPTNIILPYDQNYLTFSFAVPGFPQTRQPVIHYMLEGVDHTWNDARENTSASYSHLRPGRYTLLVKEALAQTPATTVSITINHPIWFTPGAKIAYLLTLFVILLGLARLLAHLQATRIRKEMLENLVMQDPLTGIPNRRKFNEVLMGEKSRCKRTQHDISVIMLDIDHFKGFNDRYGHQAGDAALRLVAKALQEALDRPEDFVARYGGEEFVVVLPNTSKAGAHRVAEKIQQHLFDAHIPYIDSPVSDRVTVSIGISTFSPQSDMHIDSGLFSADQALYQAKRNGRNRAFFKDHCLDLAPLGSSKETVHSA